MTTETLITTVRAGAPSLARTVPARSVWAARRMVVSREYIGRLSVCPAAQNADEESIGLVAIGGKQQIRVG